MANIEKNTTPTSKEKAGSSPGSSFEHIKNAMDKIKSAEDIDQRKDEQIISALEQEIQASESHTSGGGHTPKIPRIQKKITQYKQTIRARMARHPERPSEVGEAAISVIDTIATSDQDPNIIARSIGRIMKLILQL